MSDYERGERIAIKMDSHITESEAIRQTDSECKAKQTPECIAKLKAHQERVKQDHAEKQLKKARRIYD